MTKPLIDLGGKCAIILSSARKKGTTNENASRERVTMEIFP